MSTRALFTTVRRNQVVRPSAFLGGVVSQARIPSRMTKTTAASNAKTGEVLSLSLGVTPTEASMTNTSQVMAVSRKALAATLWWLSGQLRRVDSHSGKNPSPKNSKLPNRKTKANTASMCHLSIR